MNDTTLYIRPVTLPERSYTYSQSQQISMQTGFIGYLRADMDSNGEGFFSSWNDFRKDLKTQAFKDEFDEVINGFRDEGYFLHNRAALSKYCNSHPEASFGKDSLGNEREYGVRVDTDQYAYLMRLNPHKGEYNLYCYCYVREWLDRHLKQAERGIRFITPHYEEKFRLQDGDKIRITSSWGEKNDRTCRYIDEYHLEVGNNPYHICELAELMERNGATITPLRSSLPESCHSVLPSSGELIVIKRGEKGYFPGEFSSVDETENRIFADDRNTKNGVSKAQEAAMLAGSMFGWDAPAADPKNYDENGTPIQMKQKDRGDAR